MAPWLLPVPTQSWSYPKYSAGLSLRNPRNSRGFSSSQGFTFTLAGDVKNEKMASRTETNTLHGE